MRARSGRSSRHRRRYCTRPTARTTSPPSRRRSTRITCLILDGTWTHARKLYDAQRWLHELPHLRLKLAEPSRYRLRREPRPDYVATLEAIVAVLRIVESRLHGLHGLLASFAAMIDRQAAYTGAGSTARHR